VVAGTLCPTLLREMSLVLLGQGVVHGVYFVLR